MKIKLIGIGSLAGVILLVFMLMAPTYAIGINEPRVLFKPKPSKGVAPLNVNFVVGVIQKNRIRYPQNQYVCKIDFESDGVFDRTIYFCNGVHRVSHIYSKPGKFRAHLVVESGNKLTTSYHSEKYRTIRVINHEPNLWVRAKPVEGEAPLKVRFVVHGMDKDMNQKLECYVDYDGDNIIDKKINNCREEHILHHTYTTPGVYKASFVIKDSIGATRKKYKTITVKGVNNPPIINLSTQLYSVNENQSYSYSFLAGDPDGDAVTCSLQNAPGWVSLESNGDSSYTVTSSPGFEAYVHTGYDDNVLQANYTYNIVCSDGQAQATASVTENLHDVDRAPVAERGEGCYDLTYPTAHYTCKINASDPDEEDNAWLRYTLYDGPPGMTINSSTGEIEWDVPPYAAGNGIPVGVNVSDGHLGSRVSWVIMVSY